MASESLQEQLVKHITRLTNQFTTNWDAGDYAEALSKLHSLTEITKGLLVITQLTQGK